MSTACKLKIIQINDVYRIDHLPSFKTCRERESKDYDGKTLAILPGDFLSPSPLSSLDQGLSMVECMNHAGIDLVTFGKKHFSCLDLYR
jgi:2',3'-cyclic-nucleotide 2'-phosphodiesterase (5'-nucleotidase family)